MYFFLTLETCFHSLVYNAQHLSHVGHVVCPAVLQIPMRLSRASPELLFKSLLSTQPDVVLVKLLDSNLHEINPHLFSAVIC